MNDRNKTALTHRVTAVAAASLDSMGCKPVETEVMIARGWIADVASYWYPSHSEAKRLRLHEVTLPTRLIDDGDDELDMRFRLWGGGPFTVAVEVKTTAADFSGDRKWSLPYPANICVLAFPRGVVKDIPKGWYGLETNMAGDRVLKWHRIAGDIHPQHPGVSLDFVAQVGIRRDHRTRGRAFKDWAKAYRAKDGEKKTQYSAARLMNGLASWLQGTHDRSGCALRDVLPGLGIKKLPFYLDDAIEYFEAIRELQDVKHENGAAQ